MSGKGTPFATNGQITMWDLKISGIKCELSDWVAGYVLSFLLGKDSVGGSASTYYSHSFSFDTSTALAVPTTAYLQDTSGLAYKVPDLCITSATITIGANGAIQVEFDLVGTGLITGYSMTTLPALPSETYIMASDAIAAFAASGASPTLAGRHLNTTIKLDNQCTVHRAPGGGLYGMFVRKGKPKFSMSSTIAAAASDDIFYRMLGNFNLPYSVYAPTLGTAALHCNLPSSNLKSAKMGFDGDMAVWNVEMDESTAYQQAGGQPPITFFLQSSAGAFLSQYIAS